MKSIFPLLKIIYAHLMIIGYDTQDISKIFRLLSQFIKKAPQDYFEEFSKNEKKSFQEIPLYLTEKGKKFLKDILISYPQVIDTGRLESEPGFKKRANFIYVVGQFLTNIATKFDYLEIQDKEKFEKDLNKINDLYKIWGSRESMNAGHLFEQYKSKDNDTARQEIGEKLSESALLMEKINF